MSHHEYSHVSCSGSLLHLILSRHRVCASECLSIGRSMAITAWMMLGCHLEDTNKVELAREGESNDLETRKCKQVSCATLQTNYLLSVSAGGPEVLEHYTQVGCTPVSNMWLWGGLQCRQSANELFCVQTKSVYIPLKAPIAWQI